MKNVYFTSDWHLYHTNIIKYSHRPFKNFSDMNKVILQNYFETVNPGDTVFFLGDFTFGKQTQYSELVNIIKKITDGIDFHVILGNHDHQKVRSLFKKYAKSVEKLKEVKVGGQSITMCHYPMVSYNQSHRNAWQLYGHHHRSTDEEIPGKRWNVCVDVNDFKPVSFRELRKIMERRENNWDYIIPDSDRNNQDGSQSRRSLEDLKMALKAVENKFAHELNSETPPDVRKALAEKRFKLIDEIRQKKRERINY